MSGMCEGCEKCMPRREREPASAPLWLRLLFAFLMAGAIVMGGCVPSHHEDRFPLPDCPSCGPAPDRH